MSAIALHYGENVIRARFIDYASRFVRLASRYEEEYMGQTTIGFASRPYTDGPLGDQGRLGSGLNFWDESGGLRELQLNANRIEGWRKTASYFAYQQVSIPVAAFWWNLMSMIVQRISKSYL